jgi:hypothetical protein
MAKTRQSQSDSSALTHHQRTLMLWEAMGMGAVKSEPRGAERRKRPRFLVPDTMCRLDVMGINRKRTLKVAVRDVCASGACLLSSRPLPVREPVKLHPPADTQHKIDAVDAHVTYCKPGAPGSKRYRIGVEFQDSG